MKCHPILILLFLIPFWASCQIKESNYEDKRWSDVATRMSKDWYGTKEAALVAENVLAAQRNIGGWPKNQSFHRLNSEEREKFIQDKNHTGATFDNSATITELQFLSKIFEQQPDPRYKIAFLKGLDYIFEAQYEHGGWPQFYPYEEQAGYSSQITYNDNAMKNTMQFLKAVYQGEYQAFGIDESTKKDAKQAFNKGIECILKTQIIVEGKPTVWCAQHNEKSFEPAKARSYELPSFSGAESVGLTFLLMEVEEPTEEVKNAIQGAVNWFESHKVEGIKTIRKKNSDGKRDLVVVSDPNASDLWARFYDLDTEKPYFCDRDGIKKDAVSEIGYERRNGYGWYTNSPAKVLSAYPEWKKRVD